MPLTNEQFKAMFENVDYDWKQILITENKAELIAATNQIANCANLCPYVSNIMNAFRLTPFSSVKVVLIGPGPHTEWQINPDTGIKHPIDHGLAFSSLGSASKPLLDIYKCLINSKLITKVPKSNDISNWASQGVLLLNTSLTTFKNATERSNIWDTYVQKVFTRLCQIKQANNQKLHIIYTDQSATHMETYIGDYHMMYKFEENCNCFKQIQPVGKPFTATTINRDAFAIQWDPSNQVRIFTDGACSNKKDDKKNNVGGWAFLVRGGMFNNVYYCAKLDTKIHMGCELYPTNQRCEGYAILNALRFILENKITCPVTIVTDSDFYIKVITIYMDAWYRKNPNLTEKANGEPVKNSDIICELYRAYKATQNVTFQHIRSHQRAPLNISSLEYELWHGNNTADVLACDAKNSKTFAVICGM